MHEVNAGRWSRAPGPSDLIGHVGHLPVFPASSLSAVNHG